MIGPMRNPDIQNLLEAFASLKTGDTLKIKIFNIKQQKWLNT